MNKTASPIISVVVPVYMSPESIHELCLRLRNSLEPLDKNFEVLLVNDASPDDSWSRIKVEAHSDDRFVGICLSRNFGQHAAISAGLTASRGEYVVVMDCDLQDRPEEIPRLYDHVRQGFDQAVAIRRYRKDSWLKKVTSTCHKSLLTYLSGHRVNPEVGNFGIYHRRVIDVINSMPEQGQSFGLLTLWTGFPRTEIEVQHDARPYGKSSYSLRRLIRHATMDIVSHSDKPLRMSIWLGTIVSTFSLLAVIVIVIRYVLGQTPNGWASIAVMIAFSSGVTLSMIGTVGLYVGRVLEEAKGRPAFIVSERTSEDLTLSARRAASDRRS